MKKHNSKTCLGNMVLVLPFATDDYKTAMVGTLRDVKQKYMGFGDGEQYFDISFTIQTANKLCYHYDSDCLYNEGDELLLVDINGDSVNATIESIHTDKVILTYEDETYYVEVSDFKYDEHLKCYIVPPLSELLFVKENKRATEEYTLDKLADDYKKYSDEIANMSELATLVTKEKGYVQALMDFAEYYNMIMASNASDYEYEHNKIRRIITKLYPKNPSVGVLFECIGKNIDNAIDFADEIFNYKEEDYNKTPKLTLDEIKQKLGYDFDLVEEK